MSAKKYEVVKRLDAGGMAEVYIGRTVGIAGITKKVAIKRVLPHLAKNEKFMSMFLDEARVGMKLSHANVVQVFDVGEEEGTYFIVMEFIDGVSLKDIIDILKDRRQVVPLGAAVQIAAEAARGLSYAHNAKDECGTPLNIVHRDVSPPNILVSVQGEVKVTDFGLAKAASQLETTDPGVVKGKFSYLSPEAVDGEVVDKRADVFSLGIVLFELLTGKRLFLGETDYQTVQLVQRAHVPSLRMLNHTVPELLDDIVHKALAKDRGSRYQTAEELADSLTSFLYTSGVKATSRHVAELVAAVRGDPKSAAARKLAEQLMREELFGGLSGAGISGSPAAALLDGSIGDSIVDPRSWIGDLDFEEEDGNRLSGEQRRFAKSIDIDISGLDLPDTDFGETAPPHSVKGETPDEKGEKSGFFRRLFGEKDK